MSYHRSFYAAQGWYEPQGQPPGMTATNVEKAAVKAFQTSMGLPADGIVGPATIAAMAKAGLSLADIRAGVSPPASSDLRTGQLAAEKKRALMIAGGVVGGLVLLGVVLSRGR